MANQIIYERDEFAEEGQNQHQHGESDTEEEEEKEKSMPPGMAEALEEEMKGLLAKLDVVMDQEHLQYQKRMEIMEEKDLTQYADDFAKEEMERRGKGKKRA